MKISLRMNLSDFINKDYEKDIVEKLEGVHNDDINRFTGWRLQHGMSWLEDYIDNEKDIIPDVENLEKVRCW